jgi:hypothetical protein
MGIICIETQSINECQVGGWAESLWTACGRDGLATAMGDTLTVTTLATNLECPRIEVIEGTRTPRARETSAARYCRTLAIAQRMSWGLGHSKWSSSQRYYHSDCRKTAIQADATSPPGLLSSGPTDILGHMIKGNMDPPSGMGFAKKRSCQCATTATVSSMASVHSERIAILGQQRGRGLRRRCGPAVSLPLGRQGACGAPPECGEPTPGVGRCLAQSNSSRAGKRPVQKEGERCYGRCNPQRARR